LRRSNPRCAWATFRSSAGGLRLSLGGVVAAVAALMSHCHFRARIELPVATRYQAFPHRIEEREQAMHSHLVEVVSGKLIVTEFANEEELVEAMASRGFLVRGVESDGRRIELQGQPVFDGVIGPFWAYDSLRYETWEANNRLSK
jgi:hypothetical protein